MRRILVLRGGALGDFIVTLPALAALRKRWRSAQIELVGNATAGELARSRRLIDRVHSQHEARWCALYGPQPIPKALREWLAGFDLVISYWPDPDRDLARHFPVSETQRFVPWPAMPARSPAAAHYLAALGNLGIESEVPFYLIEPNPVTLASDAPRIRTSGPVAMHPGSGSPRKNWPTDRWLELMAAISAPIVVIVGAAEVGIWNQRLFAGTALEPRLRDGTLRIAANLPLNELVRVFANGRLFVGHDSGISHLAAACGLPSLLLFGPTDPAVWAPPASHVRVLRHGDNLSSISVSDVLAIAHC